MPFHLLSFEGPDDYARAGGVATRVTGLAQALADTGYETHLWFVGDPDLPGHEMHAQLQLHRWCQWISRYHPTGVYDGEEGKRLDYAASLPPFLFQEVLLPNLRQGGQAVILAEEWQTVDAVLHFDWLLRQGGLRHQVTIFWNANNTYSFERIDWRRLAQAAIITTVSRYMKHLMWGWGVDPLVIPNGLAAEALVQPERHVVEAFRARLPRRTVVSKVARWHPDKRWLFAIDTVGDMQRLGWRPLLIARGGVEAHGAEVLAIAASAGLHVVARPLPQQGVRGLLQALEGLESVDVVSLTAPLLVATHSIPEASGPQIASGKSAGMCYRIRAQHTKIAPQLLGWIAERLEDLNTPDEDVLHAHVTLAKHQKWRRTPYEAHVELTLAARRLQAMQVAKTPYEAMVAALKSVERKLRACRALAGAAGVPISPTKCKSTSHERRPSFSHEGDTYAGAGQPIRHRWTG